MNLYRDAPIFDEYTDEEYHRALHAPLGAVCVNCPHTKVQHYAAGPRCMFCDCRLFIAPATECGEIFYGVLVGVSHMDFSVPRRCALPEGHRGEHEVTQ